MTHILPMRRGPILHSLILPQALSTPQTNMVRFGFSLPLCSSSSRHPHHRRPSQPPSLGGVLGITRINPNKSYELRRHQSKSRQRDHEEKSGSNNIVASGDFDNSCLSRILYPPLCCWCLSHVKSLYRQMQSLARRKAPSPYRASNREEVWGSEASSREKSRIQGTALGSDRSSRWWVIGSRHESPDPVVRWQSWGRWD